MEKEQLLKRYLSSMDESLTRIDSLDKFSNGNMASLVPEAGMILDPTVDDDIDLELDELRLEYLEIKERKLLQKQRLLIKQAEAKRAMNQPSSTSRKILADGRIVVNLGERAESSRELENNVSAGAGDSNDRETVCSCKHRSHDQTWDMSSSSSHPRTPSTCVVCTENDSQEDRRNDKSDLASRFTDTTDQTRRGTNSTNSKYHKLGNSISKKSIASQTTDLMSKKSNCIRSDSSKLFKLDRNKSVLTCDLKYSDVYDGSDDEADETNRLILLRNGDYLDIVDDSLKVVIVLAGYPRSKMRLRQMEAFQRCLNDVIDMQFNNGLLKKTPSFLDYYLNRGAIVCICKDMDTRDWMVRIYPGLQERMSNSLILLKTKVKRLCLAILKIPISCWPASAQDAFKLLQYFNPTLRTNKWRIYDQKVENDVEITSFLIDRVSGEIIRGPNFKNVIDYDQMEFELTGYTEIYYECFLSESDDDLHSFSSRVKLLEEIKSEGTTPRNPSNVSVMTVGQNNAVNVQVTINNNSESFYKTEIDTKRSDTTRNTTNEVRGKDIINSESYCKNVMESKTLDEKENTKDLQECDDDNKRKPFNKSLQKEVLKKLQDINVRKDKEIIVWCDEVNSYEKPNENDRQENTDNHSTSMYELAPSEKTESFIDSFDNLTISRNSNLTIDSNRGIAYHRRTNYLDVENELKIAITLEGYPQNKLDGTHIRRLKHLFKEYLHKDMKMQRFTNMIIPKFQDIYLSNGAVIYICDSLETKDYLTEVLPKFINSTGLKLIFKDIKDLVRYTRVVMKLPKELAHIESAEILIHLQEKYSALKPDCWKYYSDVAGKQKRQFGVDPESLDVIKDPSFDPVYEGEKLIFRIIDRQKQDNSVDRSFKGDESNAVKQLNEKVTKLMYAPVDLEIVKAPLTWIRTHHYSDLIADDLKLYVGPTNYPESRIDESLFYNIKRAIEDLVSASLEKRDLTENTVPKFHDMYLFDGVIFIICQNKTSKQWIDRNLSSVNSKLHLHLKSTEFRGAVGIVNMITKTDKSADEVIAILQRQNPRLRTKFWRKINTVKTKGEMEVVLQIDKLSALVINADSFNKYIEGSEITFKLGHLRLLLKPKSSLEELTKLRNEEKTKKLKQKSVPRAKTEVKDKEKTQKQETKSTITEATKCVTITSISSENVKENKSNDKPFKIQEKTKTESDPNIIDCDSNTGDKQIWTDDYDTCKVILKVPANILPENIDDLNIIFDLLEDKNPGLNTELWKVSVEGNTNGNFTLVMDKQSFNIIQNKNFNYIIGGEKLKFYY